MGPAFWDGSTHSFSGFPEVFFARADDGDDAAFYAMPRQAILGWLAGTDEDRCAIVAEYFRASRVFGQPTISRRTPLGHHGDPLFAAWATRS